MPLVTGALDRVQRQAAVREITSAMRLARSQAVAAKIPIAFQANLDEHRYWLEKTRTEEISTVKTLPREIRFLEFSNGGDSIEHGTISIVFYPRGNTSGGSLTLVPPPPGDADTRYHIRVDTVTGKTRIEKDEN